MEGHVESVARGINTPNSNPGALGLASVDAVFTWVRLAQRIPVRIDIDSVPSTVDLAIGLTATVSLGKDVNRGSSIAVALVCKGGKLTCVASSAIWSPSQIV